MKKKTLSLLIAGGCTLLAAIYHVYVSANKDSIVIRHHYSGWRGMNTASTVLLIVSGAALALILCYIGIKKLQQAQAERKIDGPERVRQYFVEMTKKKRDCQIAQLILDQLNEMNDHQANFKKLMKANNISMDSSFEDILQEAENSICENCMVVVNKAIIRNEEEFEKAGWNAREKNEEVLAIVRTFLAEVADLAAGRSSGDEAVRSLTACTEAIRESMRQEV